MSCDISRPFLVHAYGIRAGSISFRQGRYWITAADGTPLGTRSTRQAAAYVLEQDALAGLYAQQDTQPDEPYLPPWWPKTFPETKPAKCRK